MLIGLTYDLRDDYLAEGYALDDCLEFDKVETVEAIERELRALGHRTERIGHVKALVRALAAGRSWEMVFNIAEGVRGFGRESQVPALLDAYGIPYTFSDPLACAVTLHKAAAKRIMRDAGVPTPDFAVVECEADIAAVGLPYPLFAKPVAEGTSKGITPNSKVRTAAELGERCRELLARYNQPVLVETYLPGREFTVGVLGTGARARAVGAMEVLLLPSAATDVYCDAVKEDWRGRVEYRLAEGEIAREAGDVALRAWRAIGCRDGGRVDIRADAAGRLNAIEINPLPGINPVNSDLPIVCGLAGMSYSGLIGGIVASAMERLPAAASCIRTNVAPPSAAPCAS
jgi:D-alanine-D-alanine ligase